MTNPWTGRAFSGGSGLAGGRTDLLVVLDSSALSEMPVLKGLWGSTCDQKPRWGQCVMLHPIVVVGSGIEVGKAATNVSWSM